jgi:nitrogen fixation/metabolism regulation signal transduction histidine kinase
MASDLVSSSRRRATEARLPDAVHEGAAAAILIVDLESRVVDEANPRALALLDPAAGVVVGRSIEAMVAEVDRARIAGLIATMAEQGRDRAGAPDARGGRTAARSELTRDQLKAFSNASTVALVIDCGASAEAGQGWANRSRTFAIVKTLAASSALNSSQLTGVATVAPLRARTE